MRSAVGNVQLTVLAGGGGIITEVAYSVGFDALSHFHRCYRERFGTAPTATFSTAGGSSLSYDAQTDTYTYVWKTEKAWGNSCREFTPKLSDGSEHKLRFRFTR